ncbi:class I SAM-dependent methyltransferase [Egibacter rhizosphaerae]|uniref:Class I SAM-dependent methyltransferase n=1 Tax=Egibacter rhizosphaerae TaxID=1670831 RepID=A0A411YLD3_9ACTN|nr:class I SAM-dependent methyltransferase [Egibacter rhizosphaerae]QBI21993.1 class I SAM-dependent methyltransferase [Egibacter rhizosphaerae]
MDRRKAIVGRGYDALADAYREWSTRIVGDPRERLLDELACRLATGAQVVDLGCNDGLPWTRRLAERFEVVGVDIAPGQIAQARRNVPNAHFIAGDLAAVELPREEFDAVVALYTLHHLPREEEGDALRRMAGWLRPGGRLLASFGAGQVDDEGEWLGVPMVFSSHDVATNRARVAGAGLDVTREEIVTIEEPQGVATFQWILGRRPQASRV